MPKLSSSIRVHASATKLHKPDGELLRHELAPGTYRIEAERLGFKAVIKSDVILHVQDTLEINFEMELGSASESVTVQGGAPLLDTESSTIGTVVEQTESQRMPERPQRF